MAVPLVPIAIAAGAAAALVLREAWKRSRRRQRSSQTPTQPRPRAYSLCDCNRDEVEELLADNQETARYGKWQCGCDKPSGRSNLYVIRLHPDVWDAKRRFRDENPHFQTGMPCVYVGETIHEPVCRFAQHVKPHYHRTFVTTYGTCLMPEEFGHRNPVPTDQAKTLEEDLGRELQCRGWAAWWG